MAVRYHNPPLADSHLYAIKNITDIIPKLSLFSQNLEINIGSQS